MHGADWSGIDKIPTLRRLTAPKHAQLPPLHGVAVKRGYW